MKSYIFGLILFAISNQVCAQEDYWVTADKVYRRTCPAESCGEVGYAMFRNKITVHEIKNNWARVTQEYDAFCKNGISKYVDSGNNKCVPENGINNGHFSEWVPLNGISKTKPADPAANAAGIELLVSGSDDYKTYKDQFVKAASALIEQKRCTEADFKEMGGFWKSTTHKDKPVYFTYCGGMTANNKIHLDVSTGKTFK